MEVLQSGNSTSSFELDNVQLAAREEKPTLLKEVETIVAIFRDGLAGAAAGGLACTGVDFFGWQKGAALGALTGMFISGIDRLADRVAWRASMKTAYALSATGVLAGAMGMGFTVNASDAVEEAVGGGISAAIAAMWLQDRDEVNAGSLIAKTAFCGSILTASLAKKSIAGALMSGSFSFLAKASYIGFARVSFWDLKEGLMWGAVAGQALESLGFSDPVTYTVLNWSILTGASFGMLAGAVMAEKKRQDLIAKADGIEKSQMTSIAAAISMGTVAAIGGFSAKLFCRHIVPIFK